MRTSSAQLEAVFSVDRPWGSFDQFLSNAVGTVKVITVEPHQRLSLQRHRLREELWRVLDGPVDITLDDTQWRAEAGETIWIPRGAVHRLGNSGGLCVRVLEIAFGTFDEGDIERLDDDYQRAPISPVPGPAASARLSEVAPHGLVSAPDGGIPV
jgi:mannose-1-phosphate guanylyltransferase/mannose-6-phosphate isomerase